MTALPYLACTSHLTFLSSSSSPDRQDLDSPQCYYLFSHYLTVHNTIYLNSTHIIYFERLALIL
jgi:hypothetical protein